MVASPSASLAAMMQVLSFGSKHFPMFLPFLTPYKLACHDIASFCTI